MKALKALPEISAELDEHGYCMLNNARVSIVFSPDENIYYFEDSGGVTSKSEFPALIDAMVAFRDDTVNW